MSKYLFLSFFLFVPVAIAAQEKMLPDESKPFVPAGYEMLDYVTGDLNGDKRPDAILILKQPGEDSLYEEAKRPFILLTRQADSTLIAEKRNDQLVMCRQCGGIFGDPYESTTITGNGFAIQFYGGSAWRWSYLYTFSYQPVNATWLLVREQQESYHNLDIDNSTKKLTIEAEELSGVSIDNFDSLPHFTGQKWKVVAKTFFYNTPKLGSKTRKGYLVKGDVVTSYRELTNFIQVNFTNQKEQSSTGFVLKKHLVKQRD